MIITHDLTKCYKKRKKEKLLALDHIDLKINKGELFGIIGPNGAGKTTFLKILYCLILPDEGSATIDGFDVVKNEHMIKNKVNLVSGEFVRSLYWRLTGYQNLKFFANLRNMWKPDKRIDELLEIFDLKDDKNVRVMKYSTGMKHKLAFAIGLLNDPPVLLLDEPLTGIDPITAFEIKQLIKEKFNDKTIVWTSHNLYEIEEMCDRIALINHGNIIMTGNAEKLKKSYWDYNKIIFVTNDPPAFKWIENAEIKHSSVEVRTKDVNKTFFEIIEIAKKKKIVIKEIKTVKPTLEEIFIAGVKDA